MWGERVPAYEAGTLGRDGVRWLLHLVEGAGVVALAAVHHCAFAFDDHCVVGQAFDGQIEVLCYFPFIIVGIIRIGTVEFVARQRITIMVLLYIAGMVGIESNVAVLVAGIFEVPGANEFGLIDG